jgi:hypothetical protein
MLCNGSFAPQLWRKLDHFVGCVYLCVPFLLSSVGYATAIVHIVFIHQT